MLPQIEIIERPEQLTDVKALWRRQSESLGFLPDGAFHDAAARKTILLARIDDTIVGYLLFRITKANVAITHLCVAPEHRGKHVASGLVRKLEELTKHTDGISLRTRRDYKVNDIWSHLGFCLVAEIEGRGRDSHPLLCWHKANRASTLFAEAARQAAQVRSSAVLDANVLFDLQDMQRPNHVSAAALLDDWIQSHIELYVTEEIFTEINRQDDLKLRHESQQFATRFMTMPCESGRFDVIRQEIQEFFPKAMKNSDRSDHRQLARAIAAGAMFFVTRDMSLRTRLAEPVQRKYGLNILSASELVVRCHQQYRAKDYAPARFAGTTLQIRPAKPGDADLVAGFCLTKSGEKANVLKARVRDYAVQPDRYSPHIVIGRDGAALAILTTCKSDGVLEIPLLRVQRGSLAVTLARQMVRQCLLLSYRDQLPVVRFADAQVQEEVASAMVQAGFFRAGPSWAKINVFEPLAHRTLGERVAGIADEHGLGKAALGDWVDVGQDGADLPLEFLSSQEHQFWPVKIADHEMPGYIIPIRPYWAQELFDEALAGHWLFGRKDELAMNTEGVYYRAAHGLRLSAPGHVLWYVSQDKHMAGSQCVRACSRLDAVETDLPKVLFSRFKRLGIYGWKDVLDAAGNDCKKPVMALRFSDTELLRSPIHWDVLIPFLEQHGIRTQLQGPQRIPNSVFLKLYAMASR